jgi:hypothetical protein
MEEFMKELTDHIEKSGRWQKRHRHLQVFLTTLIAASGFIIASSSSTVLQGTFISKPVTTFIFGLLSAMLAVVLQVINPSEKHMYHKSVRRCLRAIQGAVLYSDMDIAKAQKLRTQASQDPELVLGKIIE